MQRPGWVPIVIDGAVPRGLTDALAILTIAIVGLQFSFGPIMLGPGQLGVWYLILPVSLVSALASRSDTARKLREELALLAYGGSNWQIWLRYFLRGLVCSFIASLPFLYIEYFARGVSMPLIGLLAALISVVGGVFYAAPSLTRIRSKQFVENYKG